MDVTFLVGNGFDISLGLDTSYESFYEWYRDQPSPNMSIEQFKVDININWEQWADFEMGLGEYTSEFSRENIKVFFQRYEDARKNIITYLEQEKEKFRIDDIKEKDIDCLREGLLYFCQELSPKERKFFGPIFSTAKAFDTTIHFISYNYTDVLDKCIEKISSTPLWESNGSGRKYYTRINPEILHIHGTSNGYQILGVSNKKQVSNQELFSEPYFATTMIKSESVDSIGELWYTQADETIEISRFICIWGMSLGASDSMWWNKIAEWLKKGQDRRLIIFWYTKIPLKNSILERNQQTDIVKNHFLEYSSFTSDEKDKIWNRIHIIFNTEKVLRFPSSLTQGKELAFI